MAKAIVTGDKELDRALAKLDSKIQAKAVRSSMRAGAQRIMTEAIHNAILNPTIDTGKFVRGFKVRAKPRSRTRVGYDVLSTDPKANLLEYGTKRMPPEPTLRRAGYDNKEDIRAALIADIQEAAQSPGVWQFKKVASANVSAAKRGASKVIRSNAKAKRKAAKARLKRRAAK